MWHSSVRGLILNQTDFSADGHTRADQRQVMSATFAMLQQLAWFHRWPVIILATLTTLLCWLRFARPLDRVPTDARRRFIARIGRVPPWDLLIKLVGSIALPALLRSR